MVGDQLLLIELKGHGVLGEVLARWQENNDQVWFASLANKRAKKPT